MDGKSIMEVVMEAAYDAEMDEVTMSEMETLIVPDLRTFTPDEIKRLRESAKLRHSGWARALNVDMTTVQKWEDGEAVPEGAALKLLNIVQEYGVRPLIQHPSSPSRKKRRKHRKNGRMDKI